MKREIKFRGKSLHTGMWHYGDLIQINDYCYIQEPKTAGFFTDIVTVGQFTGLYDKDGQEIYEGDIVMTSISKESIGVVEWNYKQAAFVVHMKDSNQWYYLYEGYKIIGNIHENAELLKADNNEIRERN